MSYLKAFRYDTSLETFVEQYLPTDFSQGAGQQIKALSLSNDTTAYLYVDNNGLIVLDIDGDKTQITTEPILNRLGENIGQYFRQGD